MEYLVIWALILFVGYIATAIFIFREIPRSISDTFYMYNDVFEGLGYVFTIFMSITAALIVSPMVALGTFEWWQFLGFLCPCGIAFCGSAPLFKDDKLVKKVHYTGAIGGASTGLAWSFLLDSMTLGVSLAVLIVTCAIIGLATRTIKECSTFWLELVGFGSITIVLVANTLL